jgi:hypothetical protein
MVAGVAIIAIVAMALAIIMPSTALADITTGDTTIHGYRPDEVVSTDIEITDGGLGGLGPFLAGKVVDIVMMGLPILAVASVVVLIYNAVRNMFLPDEDPRDARRTGHNPKRPMGQVLKDIFMMYFWILFAWIIVELIIYAVTHLETMAQDTLTGASSQQQVTTQQVAQQPEGRTESATPVGESGATPVGGTAIPESAPATAEQATVPVG